MLLEGRIAIITGGCAGFGLESVQKFVEHGCKVVVADIQEADGKALEERFAGDVRFCLADVRKEKAMRDAVDLAVKHFGGLDIMYHNAGTVGSPAGVEEITVQEWNAAMEMLQTATMLAIQVAVEPMKACGKGSIILTSSGAGVSLGGSGPYAYTVAKSSVTMIGRYAALKLGKHGIRVNTIVPGAFKTALWEKHALGEGMVAADNFAKMQPLPIAGRPRYIADAALFLASDMGEFITGVVLPVDGGMTLHRNSYASIEG
ncbi:MAG TPA: SDR family oxidoreductase [Amaricoccus sp.]|uniref:SDR family NAD(P)-dependent oxidoreductase n=1 Tax=Amaricoccus sp. TaxID=1872485 RepID=UPI002B79A52F|nr:SDR family oxidoreductase [Amaricoccus sp.]HMQ94096.1 SDR family oxidoreductase [Amaricoccus sp.]HMR54389.1 SDR family oxidoreductase [Amaricoccus sp.]HMU01397.1 SDR family oxidoreductase [Amaricoccus sp.]